MFSAAECLAKAAELSQRADDPACAALRPLMLEMARSWLDVSRMAEWQDLLGAFEIHPIQ